MQNEINSLQQQLQALQNQQNKIPAGLYNQASPMVTKGGPAWIPTGLQISLAGSFIAMEGAWRQHNEIANGASDPPFGAPGIAQTRFSSTRTSFGSARSRAASSSRRKAISTRPST